MRGNHKRLGILVILLTLLAATVLAASPSILLYEPADNAIFNITNNVTFTCNASDDGQILNLTLYHNFNGTLYPNQTEYYGEFGPESDTLFLCHFNGGLGCSAGGSGSPSGSSGVDFDPGKYSSGIFMNDTDTLVYPTQGNFDKDQGTIEFWMRMPDNVGEFCGNTHYVFDAAINSESQGTNEMIIFIQDCTLYFYIYDYGGTDCYVGSDISWWTPGKMYHAAAVWDLDAEIAFGDPMTIYINGSNNGITDSYCNTGYPILYSATPSTFYVGSDMFEDPPANATLDEFRISNTVRNASQINESYYRGLGNYSGVSKSWAFYNVSDGTYAWKCDTYDNDTSLTSSAQRTLYVDMASPPTVNGIYLSPASSEGIDPGVTVNVTANVTDPSGVKAVVFQWKKIGDWNNVTMDYDTPSGLYVNASFQADAIGGVYYYRTWSNDSMGVSSYSETQTVTVAWDFTWTRDPESLGTASGLVSTENTVGILTINNTGDDALNFTITHNWPLIVKFNGSETANFYIPNHTKITLNVTALFGSSDGENSMNINVSASHPTEQASPSSLITTATINSYTGGPYLLVTITGYSSSVLQGSSYSLSARVKNIGNETAAGVWFNWTLPSGWTITSGSASSFMDDLTQNAINISNLTVTVTSSAQSGLSYLCANASYDGGPESSDCEIVGISCSDSDGACGTGCTYLNDDDCSPPGAGDTGGGGSTGTIPGTAQYKIGLSAPARLDVFRNETAHFHVNVSNLKAGTTINETTLAVTGYQQALLSVTPETITGLDYNETGDFLVEVRVPSYMEYGAYNLTMTATGRKDKTKAEASAVTVLFIHSATEQETVLLFRQAEQGVADMRNSGFNTKLAESLMEQASAALGAWDYDTVKKLSLEVAQINGSAFGAYRDIKTLEQAISEAKSFGAGVPETEKLYALSLSAFDRGDYAKAAERADNAMLAYSIEAGPVSAMKFVSAYWWALAGCALAGVVGYGRMRVFSMKRRMFYLEKEGYAIKNLVKDSQLRFFEKGDMGRREYGQTMSDYGHRMAGIKKETARLASTDVGKLGLAASQNFAEHKERIIGLIRDAQEKYFELGSMSKVVYDETVRELRSELAEIEKNMERGT